MTDESDTTDNCSAPVQLHVSEKTGADLAVDAPTVNNASPETGASFLLSATVRNVGEGESPATTLRYYRSGNSIISRSDTQVGTDTVAALAAAGTSAESIFLTAPSDAGTYYYGACVDSVTDETNTTDNCSVSVAVEVEEPAVYPNLQVGSPSVSDSSPLVGDEFTLSATVGNVGDARSPSNDAALLPFLRRDDFTVRHSGRDRRGRRPGGRRHERGVHFSCRTAERRYLLLWGLRRFRGG